MAISRWLLCAAFLLSIIWCLALIILVSYKRQDLSILEPSKHWVFSFAVTGGFLVSVIGFLQGVFGRLLSHPFFVQIITFGTYTSILLCPLAAGMWIYIRALGFPLPEEETVTAAYALMLIAPAGLALAYTVYLNCLGLGRKESSPGREIQGAFYSALWALAATALLCLGAGATHAHYTVGDEPEGFLLCGAGLSVLLAVHSFVMAITGSYWNSQLHCFLFTIANFCATYFLCLRSGIEAFFVFSDNEMLPKGIFGLLISVLFMSFLSFVYFLKTHAIGTDSSAYTEAMTDEDESRPAQYKTGVAESEYPSALLPIVYTAVLSILCVGSALGFSLYNANWGIFHQWMEWYSPWHYDEAIAISAAAVVGVIALCDLLQAVFARFVTHPSLLAPSLFLHFAGVFLLGLLIGWWGNLLRACGSYCLKNPEFWFALAAAVFLSICCSFLLIGLGLPNREFEPVSINITAFLSHLLSLALTLALLGIGIAQVVKGQATFLSATSMAGASSGAVVVLIGLIALGMKTFPKHWFWIVSYALFLFAAVFLMGLNASVYFEFLSDPSDPDVFSLTSLQKAILSFDVLSAFALFHSFYRYLRAQGIGEESQLVKRVNENTPLLSI